MTKYFIIPARGGSKGIKNKNLQKIEKFNLVEWSIIHALFLSSKKDRIIVSSDSEKILNISRGIDDRPVISKSNVKSISVETTFSNKKNIEQIKNELHLLCLKLSLRLKEKNLYGKTLTLKLKTTNFKLITRSISSNNFF